MERYYKISVTSETGKKLSDVIARLKKFRELNEKFIEKYQIKDTYKSFFYLCAVTSVTFSKEPDFKNWKKGYQSGHYIPRKNPADNELINTWNRLQEASVKRLEIDKILGNDDCFVQCGLNFGFTDFYYVILKDEDCYKIPSDCIEISNIEYMNLIKNNYENR